MSTTGHREQSALGRGARIAATAALSTVALLLGSACGGDYGLLVSIRCEPPGCSLSIPFDANHLSLRLTQPDENPPELNREFRLEQGDVFPLSLSVMAGEGAAPAEVVATAEVRDGGSSGTLRAAGEGRTDLIADAQTELIISLELVE